MKTLKKTGALLVVAALAIIGSNAFTQAAHADDRYEHEHHERHDNGRHEGWYKHEVEARRWHHRHVVPAPGVIYAPPPVIYAPPPPPPGINLVIPLDFR